LFYVFTFFIGYHDYGIGDSSGRGGEKMRSILRIEGRASKVFDIINNISQRHPHLTLEEAGQKGLLEPRLQHTMRYELGKIPAVWLNNEMVN